MAAATMSEGLSRGTIDPGIAAEFPGLELVCTQAPVPAGRSPRELRVRLKDHSDRFRGPQAIMMRAEPVPQAYRVFFRHIGLDPDTTRPPGEEAVVRRLITGGWRSRGDAVEDACTLALLETGVFVWALDAAAVSGRLGIRPAAGAELLGSGEYAPVMPAGRLVVADEQRALSVLFGPLPDAVAARRGCGRAVLFCVRVPGVPEIHVEEALWTAGEALAASLPST